MLARDSCQTGARERPARAAGRERFCTWSATSAATSSSRAALRGGVDIVQLRIKDGDDDERSSPRPRRYRRACDDAGALLIVNDRPDLALAGRRRRRPRRPGRRRRRRRPARSSARERLVGSLHALAGPDRRRRRAPASTTSASAPCTPRRPSPGARPSGSSWSATRRARRGCRSSRSAGSTRATCAAVRGAGGRRIAVVRALTDAADPERAARALRAELDPPGECRSWRNVAASGGRARGRAATAEPAPQPRAPAPPTAPEPSRPRHDRRLARRAADDALAAARRRGPGRADPAGRRRAARARSSPRP